MSKTGQKVAYIIFFLFAGLVFLTLVTAWITDGHRMMGVLGDLKPHPIIFAMLCSAFSYLAIALSFRGLLELTKHQIKFSTIFSITFVSATFNYVVSTAGAASLAVRSFLFKQHNVPYSTTFPLSVAQSMITNVVLAIMCMGGLFYLHSKPEMIGVTERDVILGVAILLAVMVATTGAVFFNQSARSLIMNIGVRFGHFISVRFMKGRVTEERLHGIRQNLEESIKLLHTGWIQLLVTLFWVTMDWAFTATTLYFCFCAVGVELSLGLVLVGFSVAFLTSTVNVVPAGLGITEMAVTGTYIHLMNIEPEKAVIATLLFRVIYFLLPLAISVAIYLDTMKKAFNNRENQS